MFFLFKLYFLVTSFPLGDLSESASSLVSVCKVLFSILIIIVGVCFFLVYFLYQVWFQWCPYWHQFSILFKFSFKVICVFIHIQEKKVLCCFSHFLHVCIGVTQICMSVISVLLWEGLPLRWMIIPVDVVGWVLTMSSVHWLVLPSGSVDVFVVLPINFELVSVFIVFVTVLSSPCLLQI